MGLGQGDGEVGGVASFAVVALGEGVLARIEEVEPLGGVLDADAAFVPLGVVGVVDMTGELVAVEGDVDMYGGGLGIAYRSEAHV